MQKMWGLIKDIATRDNITLLLRLIIAVALCKVAFGGVNIDIPEGIESIGEINHVSGTMYVNHENSCVGE